MSNDEPLGPLTEAERSYLSSQPLGRLATLGPDGSPQVRPVGFRYDSTRGSIDIGGMNMVASRKYRNVQADGRVSFVVDDLATTDPWRPRGIEIRGHAEALPADAEHDAILRIHPHRVLSWGLESDAFAPPLTRQVSAAPDTRETAR